eukprot:gene28635-35527_t
MRAGGILEPTGGGRRASPSTIPAQPARLCAAATRRSMAWQLQSIHEPGPRTVEHIIGRHELAGALRICRDEDDFGVIRNYLERSACSCWSTSTTGMAPAGWPRAGCTHCIKPQRPGLPAGELRPGLSRIIEADQQVRAAKRLRWSSTPVPGEIMLSSPLPRAGRPPALYRCLRAGLAAGLLAVSLPACKDKPDTPRLLAEAQSYQKKGDSKAAVIQLKNVLQADPEHPAARALLGDFYLEGGDVPSAEKEYRRARQAGMPDLEVLPRIARVMLLQQQFDAVLTTLPEKPASADLMAWRAYALLGLNRRADAVELLNAALATQEGNSLALMGRARLALMDNDTARARALADQTLALHPQDVDALRFRADLLRVQGKPAEARASYEQILKLRPADLQTRIDIASLLIQDGKFADAKAQLARARAVSPASLPLVFTQALLDFREQRYSAALEQLQLVLRAAPDYMPAVLLAGAVQYELNNNIQAEQHLRHFLESMPGHLYGSKLRSHCWGR